MWGKVDNMKKNTRAENRSDKRRASTRDGRDILDDKEIEELTPLSIVHGAHVRRTTN